jgi:pyruvate/2-oxoglutarate dehydrogenase complex dihydrolipoamide dehydrogenase (E3) component
MDEAIVCMERLAGMKSHINYGTIPAIVYTHPEIATVGKSEDQLKEAGVAYSKGIGFYGANGRARALGEAEGRVKILADAKTDRVLGVHIIGARAGDLIAEAATAMEFGASSEDIAAMPTLPSPRPSTKPHWLLLSELFIRLSAVSGHIFRCIVGAESPRADFEVR